MLSPPSVVHSEPPPVAPLGSSAKDSKVCCGCGSLLPIEAFRRRRAGSPLRQSRCRPCLAHYQKEYRAAKRTRRMDEFIAELRCQTTPAEVIGAMAAMTQAMGGLNGFAVALNATMTPVFPAAAVRMT